MLISAFGKKGVRIAYECDKCGMKSHMGLQVSVSAKGEGSVIGVEVGCLTWCRGNINIFGDTGMLNYSLFPFHSVQEAHLEHIQTTKMDLFAKINNC